MPRMQDVLEAEVDRIVTSPYPTQLQTLAGILKQCSYLDVETWAYEQPLQARSLVAAILAALPPWPQYLDIIADLAVVTTLRDYILEQEPNLLATTIDGAIRQQSTEREICIKTACNLLRDPLSSHVPTPATAQSLLINLFDEASRKPSSAALGRLNALVTGGCSAILPVLSVEALQRFEKNVFRILRDASDAEQQTHGLTCLSIMQSLLEVGNYQSKWQSWDRTAMCQFFNGSRALKTIQLAVLQAIWSCGDGRKSSSEDAAANLLIATRVISAISSETRAMWCRENTQIVAKLFSRLSRPELPDAMKLNLFALICTLCVDEAVWPSNALAEFERLLHNAHTTEMSTYSLGKTLDQTVSFCAARFSDKFLESHIEALSANLKDRNSSAIGLSRLALVAAAVAKAADSLTDRHFRCIDSEVVQSMIFLVKDTCVHTEAGLRRQLSGTEAARSELARDLHALLLSIALHGGRFGVTFPSQIYVELQRIAIQARAFNLNYHPAITADSRNAHHPIMNINSKLPWQESLGEALKQHGGAIAHNMQSIVHQVCRELENRCLHVEAPLREQQARVAELEHRRAELEDSYGQLESELMDRDLQIAEAEGQIRAYTTDLDTAEKEHDRLLARVSAAETELKHTSAMASEQLRDAASEREQQAHYHASEKMRLEAEICRINESSHESLQKVKALSADLQEAKEEISRLTANFHKAEISHRQQQTELDARQARLGTLQEHLHQSTEVHERLAREVQSLKEANINMEQQATIVTNDAQEQRRAAAREREAFLAEYQDKARQARGEWQSAERQLQARIDYLERQQEERDHAHDESVRSAEERNKQHMRQIAKLKKEHAAKDAELKAAQEMRNRLMSAMGFNNPPAAPVEAVQSTLPIRSLSSTATPRAFCARPATEQPCSDSEMFDETFASVDLDHTQHSPVKSQIQNTKAFKPLSIDPAQQPSGRRSRRSMQTSAMKSSRAPLRTSSVNISPSRRSPSKVAFKDTEEPIPEKSHDLHLVEGWSFTTDVLTSTPGIGLTDRNIEDDTTVDI